MRCKERREEKMEIGSSEVGWEHLSDVPDTWNRRRGGPGESLGVTLGCLAGKGSGALSSELLYSGKTPSGGISTGNHPQNLPFKPCPADKMWRKKDGA